MLNTGVIIARNGGRRVEKRREQILLDVPNTRGAALQALKDILDIGTVDLAQTLLHKSFRMMSSRDSQHMLGGAKRLGNNLNDFIQTL